MAYSPNNPNGSATSANSAPVVVASDQAAINTKLTDGTNTQSVVTEGNTFGDVKDGTLVFGRTNGSGGSAVVHSLRTDSNGDLLTSITDGTNTANILKSDGTSAATNAVMTASQQNASSTATWTTATTLNTTLAQSCIGQGTATVTTVETGTTTTAGAFTFEVYDGTNWWAVSGQQVGSYTVQSTYTLVNATNVAWQFDVAGFQQFRVRLSTAITGTGSPQVVVILQTQAGENTITPSVGWAQKLDSVNDSITNYPFGHSYTNVAAGQATTTIKSGAGVLHAIVYNSAATATSTMVMYDNTAASGTKIGTITDTGLTPPISVIYDIAFSTGLTIITGTANGADMTFVWR